MICEKAILKLKEETERGNKERTDEEERQSCINIRICPDCGEDLIKEYTGRSRSRWQIKCPTHGIMEKDFHYEGFC